MTISQQRLRLGPGDDGRAVSVEEFAGADFQEPWTYERRKGRLVVVSPEGQRHHDDSRPWRRRLASYWVQNPEIVEDVIQGAWVRPDEGTDRIGDLGVYLVRRQPAPPIPERAPDLMFEIVSPGTTARERDYVAKRREYHRLGVREYVVIDRGAETVTFFTPESRGYRRGDDYATPLLPGLIVPLAEAFEAGRP